MIRVDKDGNTIGFGNRTDVLSTSNSTENRGFLVLVINGLTGNKSSTTVGELNNDGRTILLGSFKSSIDSAILDTCEYFFYPIKTETQIPFTTPHFKFNHHVVIVFLGVLKMR